MSAQKSIVQMIFEDYEGVNDHVGFLEDKIQFIPYKKLRSLDLKAAGFSKKDQEGLLSEMKIVTTRCSYEKEQTLSCTCDIQGGDRYLLGFIYNSEAKLMETSTRVINSPDSVRYLFEYDSLGRPFSTTYIAGKDNYIRESADYLKNGEIKLTSYFKNGDVVGESIYSFEFGFRKHIKSSTINKNKTKRMVVGIVAEREHAEYIVKYKLDKRKNWTEKKVYIRTNGKKYKISKSKRTIRYAE